RSVPGKDNLEWRPRLTLLDLASRTELVSWPVAQVCRDLEFCDDGKTLLTFSAPGMTAVGEVRDGECVVTLWQVPTGRMLASFTTPADRTDKPLCARQSPDGKILALGCQDNVVRLRSVPEGRELGRLQAHSQVCSVAFSPDMRTLACGDNKGVVKLWD